VSPRAEKGQQRLAGESDDVGIIAYPTGMKRGIYTHGAEVSHALSQLPMSMAPALAHPETEHVQKREGRCQYEV
jgi:hypothetical protein